MMMTIDCLTNVSVYLTHVDVVSLGVKRQLGNEKAVSSIQKHSTLST